MEGLMPGTREYGLAQMRQYHDAVVSIVQSEIDKANREIDNLTQRKAKLEAHIASMK